MMNNNCVYMLVKLPSSVHILDISGRLCDYFLWLSVFPARRYRLPTVNGKNDCTTDNFMDYTTLTDWLIPRLLFNLTVQHDPFPPSSSASFRPSHQYIAYCRSPHSSGLFATQRSVFFFTDRCARASSVVIPGASTTVCTRELGLCVYLRHPDSDVSGRKNVSVTRWPISLSSTKPSFNKSCSADSLRKGRREACRCVAAWTRCSCCGWFRWTIWREGELSTICHCVSDR